MYLLLQLTFFPLFLLQFFNFLTPTSSFSPPRPLFFVIFLSVSCKLNPSFTCFSLFFSCYSSTLSSLLEEEENVAISFPPSSLSATHTIHLFSYFLLFSVLIWPPLLSVFLFYPLYFAFLFSCLHLFFCLSTLVLFNLFSSVLPPRLPIFPPPSFSSKVTAIHIAHLQTTAVSPVCFKVKANPSI